MRLWKAHSLGNDYLVWEGRVGFLDVEKVRAICDRNFGVGSDGILEPVPSERAEQGLRIWNPDGSIAEKSGNGLRIFANWIWRQRAEPLNGLTVSLDTGVELATATVFPSNSTVRVDMGPPRFDPEQIPTNGLVWNQKSKIMGADLVLFAVGMGNPHCVCFFPATTDLDQLPWPKWGRFLEVDARFPNRSNIQFAVVHAKDRIEARIWERGAGRTEASGSSASAVFASAHRMGWVADDAVVEMTGGKMVLRMDSQGRIHNTAPVQEVGFFTISEEYANNLQLPLMNG